MENELGNVRYYIIEDAEGKHLKEYGGSERHRGVFSLVLRLNRGDETLVLEFQLKSVDYGIENHLNTKG